LNIFTHERPLANCAGIHINTTYATTLLPTYYGDSVRGLRAEFYPGIRSRIQNLACLLACLLGCLLACPYGNSTYMFFVRFLCTFRYVFVCPLFHFFFICTTNSVPNDRVFYESMINKRLLCID